MSACSIALRQFRTACFTFCLVVLPFGLTATAHAADRHSAWDRDATSGDRGRVRGRDSGRAAHAAILGAQLMPRVLGRCGLAPFGYDRIAFSALILLWF